MVNYPTEWTGGNVPGFIEEKANYYRVTLSMGNQKQTKSFYHSINTNNTRSGQIDLYNSKEEAFKAAKKWQHEQAEENDLIKNKYRHLDKDTAEVMASSGITFKIDIKNLSKIKGLAINAYRRSAKSDRYTICYSSKGKRHSVASLIGNLKNVDYIDKNPLNLCESNMKEFGETKDIQIQINDKKEEKYYDDKYDQSIYFKYIDIPIVLPKNKWILGKPSGTVFLRGDTKVYHARINGSQRYCSKTFKFEKDGEKEKVYQKAKSWLINISYKMGDTKNLIKIIDDDKMQVKITKGNTMVTNNVFLPLIQKVFICSTKAGRENAEYYALYSINEKKGGYHGIITGFDMVDHINGDPLDNTLENLRWCDHSINNGNQKRFDKQMGYYTRTRHNEETVLSKIKIQKKTYEKYFYLDKVPDHLYKTNKEKIEYCKEMAFKYRRFVLHGEYTPELDPFLGPKEFRIIRLYCTNLIKGIISNTKSIDEYLSDFEFTKLEKHEMYNKYMEFIFRSIDVYIKRIENAQMVIYNLKEKVKITEDHSKWNRVVTPTQETNYELFKYIVESKNGKLISPIEQYLSKTSNLKVQCECHFTFDINLDMLRNERWCPSCSKYSKENVVREMLYKLTNRTFEKSYPLWLVNKEGNQLELDMFNDELKLAVEYNGIQHYEFIPRFHYSEKAFERQKRDDKLKNKLCEENGIKLITISYQMEDIENYLKGEIFNHIFNYNKIKIG